MTLSEWKKQLLEDQGYKDDETRLGKPCIFRVTTTDIHLYGGELAGAATILLREGALCFEWLGYTWGVLPGNERAYAVPPALYIRGIKPSLVTIYEGEIDWSEEIPSMEFVLDYRKT